MTYDNEIPFDDVCFLGSLDEKSTESGLCSIEQQRSLQRATRPELDPIFIGIPFKSDAQWFAEWRAEQRRREQGSR